MLQISHKQTHTKGIRTKNPINAKCVQLIELHAFACCLLSFFLAALLGSRRVTVVAQQWQASLSLPSLLGTWLSPSNRRRSAVSSELATAFAPWLLHLLEVGILDIVVRLVVRTVVGVLLRTGTGVGTALEALGTSLSTALTIHLG